MEATHSNPFLSGLVAALLRPGISPSDEEYLYRILGREAVDGSIFSPAYRVQGRLQPAFNSWAHRHLFSVSPSGSFAKGTANRSGTDIDLFISLAHDTPDSLEGIYSTLANQMKSWGYTPRLQTVSIGLSVDGLKVDLVPGRQQSWLSSDHSLHNRKKRSWVKTNVYHHIELIKNCGKQAEIRLLKLWRDQRGLEFPSFYLELAVIEALRTSWTVNIAACMIRVLEYLASDFANARFVDPSNSNNIISDELTRAEKQAIQSHARLSLTQPWNSFVR